MFNSRWNAILSDLFVNLAAGWFGVAFIVPTVTQITPITNFLRLFSCLVFGSISLLIAYNLKAAD